MMGKDFENPMGEKTLKGELKLMSACLDMGVFPGTQGGPLEHVIAAKAIAYEEALSDEYMLYCVQVIKNHIALGEQVMKALLYFDIFDYRSNIGVRRVMKIDEFTKHINSEKEVIH